VLFDEGAVERGNLEVGAAKVRVRTASFSVFCFGVLGFWVGRMTKKAGAGVPPAPVVRARSEPVFGRGSRRAWRRPAADTTRPRLSVLRRRLLVKQLSSAEVNGSGATYEGTLLFRFFFGLFLFLVLPCASFSFLFLVVQFSVRVRICADDACSPARTGSPSAASVVRSRAGAKTMSTTTAGKQRCTDSRSMPSGLLARRLSAFPISFPPSLPCYLPFFSLSHSSPFFFSPSCAIVLTPSQTVPHSALGIRCGGHERTRSCARDVPLRRARRGGGAPAAAGALRHASPAYRLKH
jgi:hypothetical protein